MELELENTSLEPGQIVRGTTRIRHSGLQHVRIGLLFREESGGWEETISQVLADGFEDAQDLAAGTELTFEIQLPGDALPSMRSKHGGLFWEVVVKSDRVGSGGAA